MCPFDDNNNKEIHIILILLFLNNPNTHSNKFHNQSEVYKSYFPSIIFFFFKAEVFSGKGNN